MTFWVSIRPSCHTTEAHGGQFVGGALRLNNHHASAMEPLDLESSWAADQVHIPCVENFKAKLLKPRPGIPGVDIELKHTQRRLNWVLLL